MKRKQKSPRRTRRQASFKPSDDATLFGNPHSAEESFPKIEENSKMPHLQCDFKDRNGVHSEGRFYSESGFSNNPEEVEKKHQEAPINSENSIRKNLGNTNFDALKRGLKRRTDDRVLPAGLTKRPTACGNFRNESEDGKMPIILDVFTLSEVPPSYIKKKTTNTIRENNFPVTPPCSPPLTNLEQFTGIRNNGFRERNTMRSFSGNGVAKQPFKQPTMISSVHNIYRSTVRHDRQNANNGSPIAMIQHMCQTNCTIEDQTRSCYNASHGDSIQIPQATVKDNIFPHASKFAPADFVPDESKLISESSSKKEQDIFKVAKTSDRVYSELLQDAHRNNVSKYELLKFANGEQKDIEQTGLKCLPASKNNVVFCDKMEQTLEEHETGSVHNSSILPEVTLTCKPSDAVTQSIDECKNGANRSNVFLSPRDIKVLQLKKRLKEQEAVLNKLRKNH